MSAWVTLNAQVKPATQYSSPTGRGHAGGGWAEADVQPGRAHRQDRATEASGRADPDWCPAVVRAAGLLGASLAQDAAAAIESRDPRSGDRLAQADDEVDALHRRIFRVLFSQDWSHGVEPAVDTALIGRYYERFADHAVAIARQVSFLVHGPPPER